MWTCRTLSMEDEETTSKYKIIHKMGFQLWCWKDNDKNYHFSGCLLCSSYCANKTSYINLSITWKPPVNFFITIPLFQMAN